MNIEKTAPGLEDVVAAETKLSSIDGEAGQLIILGHHLPELAQTSYDRLYQEMLETDRPLGPLRARTHEALKPVLPLLPTLPPIQAVRLALSSLADQTSPEEVVAALPVVLAGAARGTQLEKPDPDLSHAEDFARLFFGRPVDPKLSRALDTYLVTVSEHGMNASTFTCRVIASTGARPVAAAVGAFGALSGPLHGGAPGPVLDMLDELEEAQDIRANLKDRLARGERLMGFGHRVYRARDPRAEVLKQAVCQLARSDRLEHTERVEEMALQVLHEQKPERSIKTNVEFYTAVLLNEIGFDRRWFTAVFATGRILGWMAHYLEQQQTGRLIRPKSKYVGPESQTFAP